jgi:hypothetical protein
MSKPERQPLVQRRSEVDLAGGECRLPFFFVFPTVMGDAYCICYLAL